MAGCFDNVNLECACLGDGPMRRNIIASLVAGSIFAIGWWIVIDAAAIYTDPKVRNFFCRSPKSLLFRPAFRPNNHALSSILSGVQSCVPHLRCDCHRGAFHDQCRVERSGPR